MTAQKHLKQRVRARMQKTGESYSAARRHIVPAGPPPARNAATRWHFSGDIPATTALRVLLAHAGVHKTADGHTLTEPLLFVIAGGVGAGLCSFLYEKMDFASFFVAGRHQWYDDLAYIQDTCKALGVVPTVRESSGAKSADKYLRELLQVGPCIAWIDAASLPDRAMPLHFSGSGYHVVTVYAIDDQTGTATIGDRTDEPQTLSLDDLAGARARIKKFKNRVLALPPSKTMAKLPDLVRSALRRCHQGLASKPIKGAGNMFNLESLRQCAEYMNGSDNPNRWERVFARGHRLWRGLTSLYDFTEHYGTGGGLCRPIFAKGLTEAATALGNKSLKALAAQYAQLGKAWSEIASAALPDNVALLREAKQLLARKAKLLHSGKAEATDDIRAIWARLGELEKQARENFPLSEADCTKLRIDLQQRMWAIYEGEIAAQASMVGITI